MLVTLIICQYITAQELPCTGKVYWCKDNSCLISELSCNVSKTGNIWLPKECFKEIK